MKPIQLKPPKPEEMAELNKQRQKLVDLLEHSAKTEEQKDGLRKSIALLDKTIALGTQALQQQEQKEKSKP